MPNWANLCIDYWYNIIIINLFVNLIKVYTEVYSTTTIQLSHM